MGTMQSANNDFFQRVYQNGLYDLIDQHGSGGMSGTFGTCRMRSFLSAGRVMITFAQPGTGGRDKCSYTIVGLDGDSRGESFNADSREGTDTDITAMLLSLLDKWPSDRRRQAQMFRAGNTFLGTTSKNG